MKLSEKYSCLIKNGKDAINGVSTKRDCGTSPQ